MARVTKELISALATATQSLASATNIRAFRRIDQVTEELLSFFQEERGRVDGEEELEEPHELTELAQRISNKCAGMKITGQAVSRMIGRAYSGDIRAAIAELVEEGLATKVMRNLYEFNCRNPAPTNQIPKNVAT